MGQGLSQATKNTMKATAAKPLTNLSTLSN